jgi:hypothetical protein
LSVVSKDETRQLLLQTKKQPEGIWDVIRVRTTRAEDCRQDAATMALVVWTVAINWTFLIGFQAWICPIVKNHLI